MNGVTQMETEKQFIEIPDQMIVVNLYRHEIAMKTIRNRRFLFNPDGTLILAEQAPGYTPIGSHIEDFRASGVETTYGEFIRGWIGNCRHRYPDGVLDFYTAMPYMNTERFQGIAERLMALCMENGMNEDTRLRYFLGVTDRTIWEYKRCVGELNGF